MKNLTTYITKLLMLIVNWLNPNTEVIQGINKQDIELITKAFPPFVYRKGMTQEELAHETIKCWGEQRVLSFILARIQGRIGQGIPHA